MELLESLLYMLGEMSPYILLGFIIAGLLHAFVPRHTMSRHLAGIGAGAVVKSALFGIPLPLCSCGVLPTAIGLRRSGASRAATTSFLIATPQTGVDSIAATWSLLGPAFAIIRPIAALVTAIGGGIAVGRGEKCAGGTCATAETVDNDIPHGFWHKCAAALRYGFIDLTASIGGWLVAGLVIAALITVYVPADFFSVLGDTPILSMLAVLIVAIPMYVCATGSIPIAMSLMLKGLSPGTALVLLMAGPAANFASFTLISREMGRRAAFTYLAAIIIGAIGFGLVIDYLLPREWFMTAVATTSCHGAGAAPHIGWFATTCSAILVGLLLYTFIRRKAAHHNHTISSNTMTSTYTIKGMNCPHCQAAVTKAIATVSGVDHVDVDLRSGKATVEGSHSADELRQAVRMAGFDVTD